MEKLLFSIQGMSCAACVRRVERAVMKLEGVIKSEVSLVSHTACVEFAPPCSAEAIVECIKKAGYEAAPLVEKDEPADESSREVSILSEKLTLALLLALPVFLVEMGGHVAPALRPQILHLFGGVLPLALFEVVMTSLLLLGPGAQIMRKGLRALAGGRPDMNSQVFLGAGAAWLYSSYVVVLMFARPGKAPAGHIYYEAAAMIVTLVLLGRFLETRTRNHTGRAIRDLMNLRPPTARTLRNGEVVELPIAELRVGDEVYIRPGENIPVDGTVIEGASFVDEAMLTGEATPVLKEVSQTVIAGTINQNGSLTCRVDKAEHDTMLAHIVRVVRKAQNSKLPIQSKVDEVAMWFAPFTLLAAGITCIAWLCAGQTVEFALSTAIAVVIVACPCAMGLAIPTSVIAATGRAAREGILFQNAEALQRLCQSSLIALDKTGTLTQGQPAVSQIERFDPLMPEPEILQLAASAEQHSEHPLARALINAAHERAIPLLALTDFTATPGRGIRACINGAGVVIGNARFLKELQLALPAAADQHDCRASRVYMAVDGRVCALFLVSDSIRPEAAECIRSLQQLGIRTAVMSGDTPEATADVAGQLGVEQWHGGLLPADKAAVIAQHKQAGATICFVGDGINDAPALAQADIGIAMGAGSDIAIGSADVVLVSGHLGLIPAAVRLSGAARRNISQNLFWAFGYNTLLIPLAGGVLYPFTGALLSPVLAAAAMACSSVLVVLNSLRLNKMKL